MKLSNSPPVRVVARTIGCLLFAFAFSGCASIELLPRSSPDVPVVPPYGLIYTQFSAPIDHDFSNNGAPTPTGDSLKRGTSGSNFVMIWPISSLISVGVGDVSVEAAAEDGNISKVYYADYDHLNILMIFSRTKITAYGE
jgi:hypothetical protein